MKKWMPILLILFCACVSCAVAEETIRETPEIIETPLQINALPLAGAVIGIDPGHQAKGNSEQETISPTSGETKAKVSSGTAGRATGVSEYIVNLDVALQLRDALTLLGAEVYMTRETHEVDISNQQRAVMMNDVNADLVLRIHCNGSTNAEKHGMGMYVRASGACAEESAALAKLLLREMTQTTGARDDGVHYSDSYTGLNWSAVPSVLVEMGFMSNLEEDRKLNDPAYQQLLVEGMTRAVIAYIDDARTDAEG